MERLATTYLERWVKAGLLDSDTAARIVAFEAGEAPPAKQRWAAAIAWGFGALLIGTGIVSFVASNWQEMSPSLRMVVILVLTAGFHGAAGFAVHLRALHLALHGIGTVCLGAGIALAAQIFNLETGWNSWMLLWAIGAAIGYWLIRDWLQLVILALLLPLWITSEWAVRGPQRYAELPILSLWFGLALLYFLSRYRPLVWLGGIGLLPVTIFVLVFSSAVKAHQRQPSVEAFWTFAAVILMLTLVSWSTFGGFEMRGLLALATALLISFAASEIGGWIVHCLLGIAFVALCAWGVDEQRAERVNVGVAGFAVTVFGFYVSHALSLLGSSIGLIVLGLLMLGGGFALEKARRRLLEGIS